jgi:uncharacterized membrane protein (UPF0127 family)
MITLEVRFLKTLSEKSTGLLGATKAHPVYFTTRWGIHTFGMKFSIDVLILSKDNVVERLAEQLKPNRIFLWNPRFGNVVELPAGEIKKHAIKKGDKVTLRFISVD